MPVGARGYVKVPTGALPCPNSGVGASCSRDVAAASGQSSSSPVPSLLTEQVAAPEAVQSRQPAPQIDLSADKTILAPGDSVELTASTTVNASGSPLALEIFDQATQAQVGACVQVSTCQVAFSADGGEHQFIAYLAVPSPTIPVEGIRLESTTLNVQWLAVNLVASNPSVVGPGTPVTFTARASTEVSRIGYQLNFIDGMTSQRLTYCSQGITCSTSLVEPDAGTHQVIATLTATAGSLASPPVQLKSAPVAATWLGIGVTASAYSLQGGTTAVVASANADLTATPWDILIYRNPGQLVGGPCVAATCTANVILPASGTPSFFAVIARKSSVTNGSASPSPTPSPAEGVTAKSDIQVRSANVTPVRMLWGVDSCASFTQDAAGSTGLLPQVSSMLGAPDFWARYLPTTGNCPALSTTEIAAARSRHMGILPIYNDYDCSAVSGAAAGAAYAASAVQIAAADLIPSGTGIAIDIEPPGDACPGAANVDAGFITAWYDGIASAGYAPIYYGNTTPGSEFGRAWCSAVGQRPAIAANSFLWTFEPDLLGVFAKSTAPEFAPNYTGCAGQYDAWQYRISDGSPPDVDHDEATNQLPIWYP